MDLESVINNLHDMGFYKVVIPFLLFYTISFLVLEKAKIFKSSSEDEKASKFVRNGNVIISFVFGMVGVSSAFLVDTISSLIVVSVGVLVFFFCMLLILGLVFGEDYLKIFKKINKEGEEVFNHMLIYVFGFLLLLFLIFVVLYVLDIFSITDFLSDFNTNNISDGFSNNIFLFIILAFTVFIIFFISKSDKSED